MPRRLTIKKFKVTNTTTGHIAQSGRNLAPSSFLSNSIILTDLSLNVPTTNSLLTQITNGALEFERFSRSYIKIIRSYTQDISGTDEVYIPDRIARITFLSSSSTHNSSLLYAFSSSPNTDISSLTWNVVIANTTAQTSGDYFDFQLPDSTYYPTLYVCFLVIKDAWLLKQITDANLNICSINNVSRFHYCVHPQKCLYDKNRSHYIYINGLDTTTGIKTRITFGVEINRHGYHTNRDYYDLIFSLSSRTYLNENQPT